MGFILYCIFPFDKMVLDILWIKGGKHFEEKMFNNYRYYRSIADIYESIDISSCFCKRSRW